MIQISVLLKECRDIQLRCGSDSRDHADVEAVKVTFETNGDTEKVISERLVSTGIFFSPFWFQSSNCNICPST